MLHDDREDHDDHEGNFVSIAFFVAIALCRRP